MKLQVNLTFEQLQVYLFLSFFLNKMHTNLYYAIDESLLLHTYR